jgi:hypothetical protein
MKDLIKKILRKVTSELTDGQIKSGYVLMNNLTKRYKWYHDTPEQPFYYTPGSIWLINPETEKWMLELEKSGELWYYTKTSDSFSKYLNMEQSYFELFIKIWVEDALKRGVVSTNPVLSRSSKPVEDALKKGKQLK